MAQNRTTSSNNITTKHKDNVFCLLYQDKRNLLDLYNALNNSSYTDIDGLEVTTLPNGSYMKYKNDASFVIDNDLYMFEQQATKNPNMPMRFLHYVSEVYKEKYSNKDIQRKTMLKIPVPHFVVFYNGIENMRESEIILKLSDMFEKTVEEPELELVVKVININPDTHSEILKKCGTLRDYMTFVNKVRTKQRIYGQEVRQAVIESVNECINENILADFFREHRQEVIDMSIFEYDEKGHMEVIREEGYNEGHAAGFTTGFSEGHDTGFSEGRDIGFSEGRDTGFSEGRDTGFSEGHDIGYNEGKQTALVLPIIKKVIKGKTMEQIADELEESATVIKPIYEAVTASAPDYNYDEICNRLKK